VYRETCHSMILCQTNRSKQSKAKQSKQATGSKALVTARVEDHVTWFARCIVEQQETFRAQYSTDQMALCHRGRYARDQLIFRRCAYKGQAAASFFGGLHLHLSFDKTSICRRRLRASVAASASASAPASTLSCIAPSARQGALSSGQGKARQGSSFLKEQAFLHLRPGGPFPRPAGPAFRADDAPSLLLTPKSLTAPPLTAVSRPSIINAPLRP
jgi:hypothetical protein